LRLLHNHQLPVPVTVQVCFCLLLSFYSRDRSSSNLLYLHTLLSSPLPPHTTLISSTSTHYFYLLYLHTLLSSPLPPHTTPISSTSTHYSHLLYLHTLLSSPLPPHTTSMSSSLPQFRFDISPLPPFPAPSLRYWPLVLLYFSPCTIPCHSPIVPLLFSSFLLLLTPLISLLNYPQYSPQSSLLSPPFSSILSLLYLLLHHHSSPLSSLFLSVLSLIFSSILFT
jgi:hypothetical protein